MEKESSAIAGPLALVPLARYSDTRVLQAETELGHRASADRSEEVLNDGPTADVPSIAAVHDTNEFLGLAG